MNKIRTAISRHIRQLVLALFVLQPVLDVISYWTAELGISNTVTLALRLGVLFLLAFCGFVITGRRRVYYGTAAVLALLYLGHVLAVALTGIQPLFADFTNFIRIAQIPVATICLITFFRHDKGCFDSMMKGMTIALFLIFGVEAVSHITGTNPKTYPDGLGLLGWFTFANSQGAILCGLLPLSLGWQITRKPRNLPLLWATAVLGVLALYLFATRLAYLGIYLTLLGLIVCILIARRKDWKIAVGFVLLAAAATLLYPLSPNYHHLYADEGAQTRRQDAIQEMLKDCEQELTPLLEKQRTAPETLSGQEHARVVELLTPVYEAYTGDFVTLFGAEEAMEMYGYSTNIYDFANVRQKKLLFAERLLRDSSPLARVFGVNYSRFIANGENYDVENDFSGLYYLYGIAGLGAMLAFLLYFVWLICWALWKNWSLYFTVESGAFGVALVSCMINAFFTAGVLRRPNASIYLSAILAGIYCFVRIRYGGEGEQKIRPAGSQTAQT